MGVVYGGPSMIRGEKEVRGSPGGSKVSVASRGSSQGEGLVGTVLAGRQCDMFEKLSTSTMENKRIPFPKISQEGDGTCSF